MRKAIKEKILQQKKGSQFYVKMICEGQSSLSREVFGRLFLQYMCAKFLLAPEEITTDNYYEICQKTVCRLIHLHSCVIAFIRNWRRSRYE